MMGRKLLFFLVLAGMAVQGQGVYPEFPQQQGKSSAISVSQLEKGGKYPEMEDEIPPYSYEQEIISKKLYQKNLPSLSKREKITWAFKTARTSIFL